VRRPASDSSSWGLLLAALLLAGPLAGCGGLENGGKTIITTPSAGVFPPNSSPYGKTYGEWSAVWWQWDLLLPLSRNPAVDPTGQFAGEGQSGPVWFLAGTYGGRAERTCTIPTGKGIFFPIVCSGYVCNLPTDTEPVARGCVRNDMNRVTDLELTVDNVSITGLESLRCESLRFDVLFDADDPLWPVSDPGPYPAYSDGCWVMLEPLSPGTHTIDFRGKLVQPESYPKTDVFETVVTYHLTVQ